MTRRRRRRRRRMDDEDDEYNGLETHLRLESLVFLLF
jgi:hypothetical protein